MNAIPTPVIAAPREAVADIPSEAECEAARAVGGLNGCAARAEDAQQAGNRQALRDSLFRGIEHCVRGLRATQQPPSGETMNIADKEVTDLLYGLQCDLSAAGELATEITNQDRRQFVDALSDGVVALLERAKASADALESRARESRESRKENG